MRTIAKQVAANNEECRAESVVDLLESPIAILAKYDVPSAKPPAVVMVELGCGIDTNPIPESTFRFNELERSKVGQSDERTIYKQRLHALTRQGDEVQQMEIELKAQVIARSEIMELQNSFEIRMKEQVDLAEELSDSEQKMHDLERKIEDQERELHAMRLDNEKVNIPLGLHENLPVAVSLLAKHSSDKFLLDIVEALNGTWEKLLSTKEDSRSS
ncbi:hypothetical protein Droror1_Dr00006349 [Drosera rotundifolia]